MKQKKVLLLIVGILLAAAVAVGLFFGVKALTKSSGESTTTEAPASDDVPATQPAEQTDPGSEDSDLELEEDEIDKAVATRELYTVDGIATDDSRWEQIVATSGDYSLTSRVAQVYYYFQFVDFMNGYGSLASYFLDTTQPFSEQSFLGTEKTFEQYFLACAIREFEEYGAVATKAKSEGYAISEAEQAQLDSILEALHTDAEEQGLTTDAYLQQFFGSGVTEEAYMEFVNLYFLAMSYESQMYEALEWTDDELLAYYNEHRDDEDFAGLGPDIPNVNVRHILIKPAETELPEDATDEERAAAETAAREAALAKAQELLTSFQENPTEEYFAQLAGENTEDPGSADNGGLYEDVYPGQMVETFNDWCFDPARQTGDTGIVETDYGFHVMYFAGKTDNYQWLYVAEEKYPESLMIENIGKMVDAVSFDMHVENVVLAPLPLDEAE